MQVQFDRRPDLAGLRRFRNIAHRHRRRFVYLDVGRRRTRSHESFNCIASMMKRAGAEVLVSRGVKRSPDDLLESRLMDLMEDQEHDLAGEWASTPDWTSFGKSWQCRGSVGPGWMKLSSSAFTFLVVARRCASDMSDGSRRRVVRFLTTGLAHALGNGRQSLAEIR